MRQYDRKKIKIEGYQKLELQMMPTRVESTVYAQTTICSPDLPRFLKENQFKVFSWMLFGWNQTIAEFPSLNRFVLKGKLYQHKKVVLSTVIKKDKSVEGDNTFGKLLLESDMSVMDIQNMLNNTIKQTRSEAGNNTDTLMKSMGWMPAFGFKLIQASLGMLDRWDLLPNSIIDSDPLHATAIVANLGSIDGFSVDHHLYNWGTASMFISFGRLQEDGTLDVSFSVDERISEGLILFKALEKFKHIMENPYDYV
jgi:chloramphenicol O-acetyltransferase